MHGLTAFLMLFTLTATPLVLFECLWSIPFWREDRVLGYRKRYGRNAY